MRLLTYLVLACCCASPAVRAATPFDGVYTGSTQWAGNGNARCPSGSPDFRMTVRDGVLNFGTGSDRVSITVAPDGSFSGQSGQRYLQGKIAGNQMTATSSGIPCNYVWSLTRAPR